MSSKSRNVILAIFFAVHGFTPIRAAESDREATERLYREYTESYQKAAEAYEKSVKQGQTNAYVSYAIAAVFVILIFAVALRTQRFYGQRSFQMQLANQKLLEEIRDLLKQGRP